MPSDKSDFEGEPIKTPHDHDVLSGRGNYVNYHAGNEHFRALVRKHKMEYVKCPKAQKGKFSKIIVDEIRARDPPGRFLKQDPATKLWYDIGDKKSLDKTRQALREGAPEIMKDLSGESGDDDDDEPSIARKKQPGNNNNSFRQTIGSPGGMFPGDSMSQMAFMQNSMNMAMASPVISRNALQMGMAGFSPAMSMSPGMGLSPGMGMMMTPDMQLSAQQMQLRSLSNQMDRMPLSQAIPPPPMGPPSTNNTPQQQMRHELTPQQQMRNQLPPQQPNRSQLTPQQQMAKHMRQQNQMDSQNHQQQQMMMNASGGMGGMRGAANFMGGGDMMTPQQMAMMNNMNGNPMMNPRQQQQQQLQQRQMTNNSNMMNPQMQQQQQQQQPSRMMGSQQQQQQKQAQHTMNNGMINEQEQQQLNQQQLKQLREEQKIYGKQQRQGNNEMQLLQNKLAAIYSADSLDPRPLPDNMAASGGSMSDGQKHPSANIPVGGGSYRSREPPSRSSSEDSNAGLARLVDNELGKSGSYDDIPPVATLAGNNPRRAPPSSLLKRENSLKMEKIFEPASPKAESSKKPYSGNHSSAHISAMSLSMGDLGDEGDLSQVFDSSLRISTSTGMSNKDSTIHQSNRSKTGQMSSSTNDNNARNVKSNDDATGRSERTSGQFENHGFDMSVATIGMSDAGNMSYATFGDGPSGFGEGPDNGEDVMSFSKVFEDPNKP